MASIKWTQEALDSLAQHDAWRLRHGWDPIAREIFQGIEIYLNRQNPAHPPRYIPGHPVGVDGVGADLRVITIKVRSKLFRVFFRYLTARQTFEIIRVFHPGAALDA